VEERPFRAALGLQSDMGFQPQCEMPADPNRSMGTITSSHL